MAGPEPTDGAGTLIRSVGYEAGESRAESAHTATSDGLTTTNEAARAGRRAGVALLEPGTPKWKGNLGFRSEWHGVDVVAQHVERWQGISYLVPADWHQGVNPDWSSVRIIFQWHATGSAGVSNGEPTGQSSPVYGLLLAGSPDAPELVFYRKDAYVREGRLRGRNVTLWSEPVQPERWTDFAFNTVWSTGSDGKMVVYRNGEEVYRYSGPTLTASTRVYSKWGVYGQPTRLIFDEVRIAEGRNLLDLVSP